MTKKEEYFRRFYLSFVAFFLLNIWIVSAVYTDTGALTQSVNDCGILNTTNAVYTLTQNVTSNETCFAIRAHNITFDGAGYTINYSANGTLGNGINVTSINYTTVKNSIIVEGNSTNNAKYAVYLSGASHSLFFNNSITTIGASTYSFYLKTGPSNTPSNYNNISFNKINSTTGSGAVGIGFDGSSYDYIGSNLISATSNNGQLGITMTLGNHNYLYGNNITSPSHGISFSSNITNTTFSNMHVLVTGSTRNALQVSNAVNISIIDSVLNASGSAGGAFAVLSTAVGGTWNLTNVTGFGGTALNVTWASGANGTLNFGWYLDVNVSDYSTNVLIEGANVTAWDNNGVLQFNKTSGSNGKIGQQILLQYTRNVSSTTYYSYYSINVTNSSYDLFSNSTINLTGNTLVNALLIQTGSDVIFPQFTNYYDNNASLVGFGLALFNVTVTNTNGTVFLEVNGTNNYTASNLTLNVYNVSLNLSNYTYSYKWIGIGNGISKNINSSIIRYYTLNNSDATAPVRSSGSPTGILIQGTPEVNISLRTDEIATCRYSNISEGYASMSNTFVSTGSTVHSTNISGLQDGYNYSFFVSCNDSFANVNLNDFTINFSIDYIDCSLSNIKCVAKSGLNQEYSTIQSCADAATPGDVCFIFNGYYNETVSTSVSGTSGNYVNFTGGYNASARSFIFVTSRYINLQNLEIWNNMSSVDGIQLVNTSYINILNNYIHHLGNNGISTQRGSTPNSTANYTVIRNNRFTWAGVGTNGGIGIDLVGYQNLIEGNDISYIEDYARIHGMYNVIRNNTFHDSNNTNFGAAPNEIHLDGMQTFGNDAAATRFMLLERNYMDNTSESLHNVHFSIFQNYQYPRLNSSNAILRYNFARDVESFMGADINFPDVKVYNNDILYVSNQSWTIIGCSGNSTGCKIINNILYNATRGAGEGYSNTGVTEGFNASHNLAYNNFCGSSCTWSNPINTEPFVLKNQFPMFVDNATNFSLQAGSPAIDSGGPLTYVLLSDSGTGTGLLVNDSGMFQDGWAGVNPDWIALGNSSNVVQISSINYSNHTITLANSISRNPGDPIYLYKDSYGEKVLYGNVTDRGAFEFFTSSLDVASPVVILVNPSNGLQIGSSISSFNATFTEDVQLSNVTLYVWNSTNSIINQTTVNLTGTSNSSNISFVLPYADTFKWNYLAYDNSSNEDWGNSNFTLTYTSANPNVTIVYPANTTYNVNVSTLNYTCAGGAYVLYSRDNFATNSSIVTCGTNFTNVLSVQGTNTWRVAVNDSFNHLNITNVTFYMDTVFPQFTNYYDNSGGLTGSGTARFNVTLTNTNGTVKFYFNGVNYSGVSVGSGVYTANLSLSSSGDHTYYWISWSNSSLKNMNVSTTRTYTVLASSSDDDSSSSSGGGGASKSDEPIVYTAPDDKLQTGYTKLFKANSKIKFNFEEEAHSIMVDEVNDDSVDVTVSSTPQTATIYNGQEKLFNLDGDDYFDLIVKVGSISGKLVNMTIKQTHELIPKSATQQAQANSSGVSNSSTNPESNAEETSGFVYWIIFGVVAAISVGYFLFRQLRTKK